MGRETHVPGQKRNASNTSVSKKSRVEEAGPSKRRGSKEKKSAKILHTVNSADKNKNNYNRSAAPSKLVVKVTPTKVVLARAERLKAKPENRIENSAAVSKSEKHDLEKCGYILSNFLGQKVGCSKYRTHYIKAIGTSPLRRKYHLWCKAVDKSNVELMDDLMNREVHILSNLRHPNVVKFHSILQNDRKLFCFTSGGVHGDVLNFLALYGPLMENHGRVWFRQILNGLEYLYSKNISHGNLNCESLLLGDHYNILIGDFGYAQCYSGDEGRTSRTSLNKSLYTAPEVLLGNFYNPRLADMWSLGIVLYSFFMGHPPFYYYGDEDEQIAKLVVNQLQLVWLYRVHSKALALHSWQTLCSLLEPDVLKRANLRFLKQSSFYCMKECVCGYGSFKALSTEILNSLPDLYTTVKPSEKSKSNSKNDSEIIKSVCPSFKEFFSPRMELSLKIEDAVPPTLITVVDDGSTYCS